MGARGSRLMRAWRVRAHGEPHDALEQVELPLPEPGAGQVRVRVEAAGLGLPDLLLCRGRYPLTQLSGSAIKPSGLSKTASAICPKVRFRPLLKVPEMVPSTPTA